MMVQSESLIIVLRIQSQYSVESTQSHRIESESACE